MSKGITVYMVSYNMVSSITNMINKIIHYLYIYEKYGYKMINIVASWYVPLNVYMPCDKYDMYDCSMECYIYIYDTDNTIYIYIWSW